MTTDHGETLSTNFSSPLAQVSTILLLCFLENAYCIWWARNSAGEIQGRACEEKAPFIELLANLCQFIQVEHLSNGHSEKRNKIVMQPISLVLCRPRLKDIRISTHCCKVLVPEPLDGFFGTFHASPIRAIHRSSSTGFWACFFVPFDKPGPYQQNIASPKVCTLPSRYGFEVPYREGMTLNRGVADSLLLSPSRIIEEDTSTDNPTSP